MRFRVTHTTRYTYPEPVQLGEHRLMLRPRDSHDMRLVEAALSIAPPAQLRWQYDVFGNSVCLATFEGWAPDLVIESTLLLERFARHPMPRDMADYAKIYPFVYPADVRTDLGALLVPDKLTDQPAVLAWIKRAVGDPVAKGWETLALLARLNAAIQSGFRYEIRTRPGTQSAGETIGRGAGTCRDFALLLIEAARALGFGARFATGYLYSPDLDPGGGAAGTRIGAAQTHAWAEIYLPGAGWYDYDPTNAIVASPDLIRVASVRAPEQAAPVTGSYYGASQSVLDVSVQVEAV